MDARNERESTIREPTDVKGLIKEHYKKFDARTFENYEVYKFLKITAIKVHSRKKLIRITLLLLWKLN